MTQFLHWTIIVLTISELGLGWLQSIASLSREQAHLVSWLHGSLGAGLAVLVVLIVLWRLAVPSAAARLARPVWLGSSVRFLSVLMYLLLVATLLSGILDQSASGKSAPPWALTLPSWISVNAHLTALASRWHPWSAIALAAVIALYLVGRARIALRRDVGGGALSTTPLEKHATHRESPDHKLIAQSRNLGVQLRIFGAVAFWIQVSLGLIAALLLIVTASSNYYDANPLTLTSGFSLASGSLWAHLAMGIVVATILGFYLCVREARRLRLTREPTEEQLRARRLIVGVSVSSAIGLTAAILGTAFSIALLVAKTVSQPPGIAITDPQKIVRAVDVFVLLANFIVVVAHFFGVLTCLWILNRIYRLDAGKTEHSPDSTDHGPTAAEESVPSAA